LKIITVIGARPQFIKASILSNKIIQQNSFSEVIIHTGQHFDETMSDIFFQEMKIPFPNYNLGINNSNYSNMVGSMVNNIIPILKKEKADAILVYGDTNSTLAGSISAAQINKPLIHVESGLRSHNRLMLEETNRIITDHLSSLLFCPSEESINNLKAERINQRIVKSGDIMYDAFLQYKNKLLNHKKSTFSNYILCTIHRRENTFSKKNLVEIFSNLDKINCSSKVVMPIHPSTRKKMSEYKINTEITLISPQSYLSLLSLLIESDMVITDSGGLQKEAFFANKKCITVREQTEWTELIDLKVNFLSNSNTLYNKYKNLSFNNEGFGKNIYGDGKSADIIVDSINKYLHNKIT
tara:strand:+ start:17630 stop:18691 length:1062 start_codon:yes stop_codon:yes gene_type:complete